MNLPELALDFLDAFRQMMQTGVSALFSGSAVELAVHCYCFATTKENPAAEINPRLLNALGVVPEGVQIREVRDVAPKKNMYCVEFNVHLQQAGQEAQGEAAAVAAAAGGDGQSPEDAKRRKTE